MPDENETDQNQMNIKFKAELNEKGPHNFWIIASWRADLKDAGEDEVELSLIRISHYLISISLISMVSRMAFW